MEGESDWKREWKTERERVRETGEAEARKR